MLLKGRMVLNVRSPITNEMLTWDQYKEILQNQNSDIKTYKKKYKIAIKSIRRGDVVTQRDLIASNSKDN